MVTKHTKFDPDWLTKSDFKDWLEKRDSTNAYCRKCDKTIYLSNMGMAALKSHAKGARHQKALQAFGTSVPVSTYLKTESVVKPSGTLHSSLDFTVASTNESNVQDGNPDIENLRVPSPPHNEGNENPLETSQQSQRTIGQKNTITKYLQKQESLKAQIIWSILCVLNHMSHSTGSTLSGMFHTMFPDTPTASNTTCSATKISYLVNFGLAPYFKECLLDEIKASPYYVLSYDESLNMVLQQEQMDVIIRYFSSNTGRVESKYFTSEFLGPTRAEDLLEKIEQLNLPSRYMLQLSMDGPNVNMKALKDLQEKRKLENLPELPETGTCSLHTVHNAFKCGFENFFDVHVLLKASGKLFRGSPARLAEYKSITGSNVIPSSFCGTRWVEDKKVAERLVEIWPNIVKFITQTEKKPKKDIPTSTHYDTVKSAVITDKLVIPKLKEFISIASLLQPYPTKFQADGPMMPFVCSELLVVLTDLMSKFIKPDKLENISMYKAATLPLETNQLTVQNVKISYAAKSVLNQLKASGKISDLQIMEFKGKCLNIYKTICTKLQDKCPLKYSLPRKLVSLNPKLMMEQPVAAVNCFETVLNKLADNEWIRPDQPEVISSQFRRFAQECKRDKEQEFLDYDPKDLRLDQFYFEQLDGKDQYKDLWSVIKMLLTISHGQAAVERGFSVNKDSLKDNLQETSLVSRRIVFDAMKDVDLSNYVIPKGLLESCKHASHRYKTFLATKEKNEEARVKERKRKSLSTEILDAKKKKLQLERSAASMTEEANLKCLEAEKSKKPRDLIIEANASRAKADQLREKSIPELEETIKSLEKELKELQ